MKEKDFTSLDAVADMFDEECDRWFDSDNLTAVREAIRRVSASLPESLSISIDVELRVFDSDREKKLRILTTGLCTSSGEELYQTSGDSSVYRYLVDGEIRQLPHDYWPHCRGDWAMKSMHPVCPDCGYSMEKELKLHLDTDIRRNCEKGSVSVGFSTCGECGFTVDASFVSWGQHESERQ